MEDTFEKLNEIFNESQHTAASHQKCSALLKKLMEKVDSELFMKAVERILKFLLIQDFKHKNIYGEKIIDFFALFCSGLKPTIIEAEDEEYEEVVDHPMLVKILDFLLLTQRNKLDNARFWSCQIINKIFDQMTGTDLSLDLCNKLETNLLERLQDTKSAIRLQGVIALHRLQDPSNPDDQIILNLKQLLSTDPFAKIRLLCVEKIASRRDTVTQILQRTRDVDPNVRLAAYKRLMKIPNLLKISDRRLIIHSGFLDTSEKVRTYIEDTLIDAWVEHYGDIITFLKSVRFDADENDIKETTRLVELILLSYFKKKPLSELTAVLQLEPSKLIEFGKLNWETTNYWRIYVEFLKTREEFEEELERVVPELIYFCKYIRDYYVSCPSDLTATEFLQQQFILKQFFLITKSYDCADPHSQQALNSLVTRMLVQAVLTTDVVETIVTNLEITIPNPERRSNFVSEIISEIMYPMNEEESRKTEIDRQYKISNIKVQLLDISMRQEKAILNESYAEAGELKVKKEELQVELKGLLEERNEPQHMEKRTEIPLIVKYLDIAAGLLLSPQITEMNATLKTLLNDVILELLIHSNEAVRTKALRCYALCCIIDKTNAMNGIHIFSTPIFSYHSGEECDSETLKICVSAVVDLLRLYGTKLMAEPDKDQLSESLDEENVRTFTGGSSLSHLIRGLVDLLDDDTPGIPTLAAKSLCCLIFSERLESSSLISILILKWSTPALEEDEETQRLKQIIGYGLQLIPRLKNHAGQLEDAILLTVKSLAQASKDSPLAQVNIDTMIKFMLALCRTSPENQQIQSNLAMKVCSEITNRPRNKVTAIYIKMLPLLEPPSERGRIMELIKLCEDFRDELRNQTSITYVTKYLAILNEKCNVQPAIMEEMPIDEVEQSRNSSNSRNV